MDEGVRIGISKRHNMYHLDGYYKPSDYEKIYETALEITGDHHIAEDIASWSELATVGETYEVPECTVFVIDDEEMKRTNEQMYKGW